MPPTPEYILRPADRSDLPALNALAWRAVAAWGYSEEEMADRAERISLVADDLVALRLRLAMHRRRLVGFSAARRRPGRWRLEHLYVHPDRRFAGVGRILLEDALAAARESGAGVIVEPDPHATAFFLRLGGRKAGMTAYRGAKDPLRTVPIIELE